MKFNEISETSKAMRAVTPSGFGGGELRPDHFTIQERRGRNI